MNKREFLFKVLNKLGFFKRLKDEDYIKLKYWSFFHKKINLQEPQSFNEKLQWLKINDHNPLYTQLVDKNEVKEYIGSLIGEKYIIPSLGVWENFDQIDFNSLPSKFVLKCTHDSGGLVVVRDKDKLDLKAAKKKINKSLKRNFYYSWREWPYKNINPKIIVEEFLDDGRNPKDGLTDFKFFCFNGEPKFLYISSGLENHKTASISFFDLEGRKLPFKRKDYKEFTEEVYPLPVNFNKMIEIAKKIAKSIPSPFVRVDLYNVDSKIYFSEITFTPCGGAIPFEPEEKDYELGDLVDLSLFNS